MKAQKDLVELIVEIDNETNVSAFAALFIKEYGHALNELIELFRTFDWCQHTRGPHTGCGICDANYKARAIMARLSESRT